MIARTRTVALILITALAAAAAATSFAESYRALVIWADGHGLHGIWAALFPLQLDVFIAVGELALFVAVADRWPARSRAAAWVVTVAGLAVSIGGNVGHVAGHSLSARCTAAVPPLAAAAALAVGLGILKRVVAGDQAVTVPARAAPPSSSEDAARMAYAASVAGGNPLAERALCDRFGVSRRTAQKIRAPKDAAVAAEPSPGVPATAALNGKVQ